MDRHECEKLYLEGLSVPEISRRTGQCQDKLRSWKSRHKWEIKKNGKTETQPKQSIKPRSKHTETKAFDVEKKADKEKMSQSIALPTQITRITQRKPGAPYGNQNAKGNSGGGPIGNQHALKHGLYAKKIKLDPEEQEWLDNATFFDEIESLQREVTFCEIRIARHMQTIDNLKEQPLMTNKIGNTSGIERGQDSDYTQQETSDITQSTIDKLNAEITKLSNTKGNHVRRIAEIKAQRAKLQVELEPETKLETNALAELSIDELRRLLQLAEANQ